MKLLGEAVHVMELDIVGLLHAISVAKSENKGQYSYDYFDTTMVARSHLPPHPPVLVWKISVLLLLVPAENRA